MANLCACKITYAEESEFFEIIEQKKIEQDQEIKELEEILLKAQTIAKIATKAADKAFLKYIQLKKKKLKKKKSTNKFFYIFFLNFLLEKIKKLSPF